MKYRLKKNQFLFILKHRVYSEIFNLFSVRFIYIYIIYFLLPRTKSSTRKKVFQKSKRDFNKIKCNVFQKNLQINRYIKTLLVI